MTYIPHKMPEVQTLSREALDEVFAKARQATSYQPPEKRSVAIVTPGRITMSFPAPTPNTIPMRNVQMIQQVLNNGQHMNITVFAYTELQRLMPSKNSNVQDINNVIPFFGYLLGMAYNGHSVVVCEGHESVLPSASNMADLIIVDSAYLPYLPENWQEQCAKQMRTEDFIIFHRDGGAQRITRPPSQGQKLTDEMIDDYQSVNAYTQKQDIEGACTELSKLIKRYPTIAFFYKQRATFHQRLGNKSARLNDLEKAIELDPQNILYQMQYGNALADNDQIEESVMIFDQIISIYPNRLQLYINRAISHLDLGHWQRAIEDTSHAIEISPRVYQGYYYRAKAEYEANLLEQALEDIEQALKLLSTPQFTILKALILQKMGQTKEASKLAKIAEEQGQHIVLGELVELSELQGDDKAAYHYLKQIPANRALLEQEKSPRFFKEVDIKIAELARKFGR